MGGLGDALSGLFSCFAPARFGFPQLTFGACFGARGRARVAQRVIMRPNLFGAWRLAGAR